MRIPPKVVAGICTVCIAFGTYALNKRSIINLKEVKPALNTLANCAIQHSSIDFVVVDGGRTETEHKNNVANGKSWIKRSKHQDGLAIDVAVQVNGKITYEPSLYYKLSEVFYYCSRTTGIPITWGGEWKVKDLMHYELK